MKTLLHLVILLIVLLTLSCSPNKYVTIPVPQTKVYKGSMPIPDLAEMLAEHVCSTIKGTAEDRFELVALPVSDVPDSEINVLKSRKRRYVAFVYNSIIDTSHLVTPDNTRFTCDVNGELKIFDTYRMKLVISTRFSGSGVSTPGKPASNYPMSELDGLYMNGGNFDYVIDQAISSAVAEIISDLQGLLARKMFR